MKCFECAGGAAGATAVSFDTFFSSFHFEKNTANEHLSEQADNQYFWLFSQDL